MGVLLKQALAILKLRIGVAMVLTALASLVVTPGPQLPGWQIVLLAVAVLLSAGAAGGVNHYYDADIDARMGRTRGRPFVTGALKHTPWWLVAFALLAILPTVAVAHYINLESAIYLLTGAFFYGVVYTVWLKRRTWVNIVIGGLAGSFAVLAGAAAVDPVLTPLPLSLALVLFLWTPPHFWSLAIAMRSEYQSAGVPMLPVVAGESRAARAVLGNTLLLVCASLIPAFVGLGWIYLVGAVAGGLWFLWRSLQLALDPRRDNAMGSFRASLVQLMLLLAGAVLDQALVI